jgi:beta-galactosidase
VARQRHRRLRPPEHDLRRWLFLLNHGDTTRDIPARGLDLLTGTRADGTLPLAPGAVAVVREENVV